MEWKKEKKNGENSKVNWAVIKNISTLCKVFTKRDKELFLILLFYLVWRRWEYIWRSFRRKERKVCFFLLKNIDLILLNDNSAFEFFLLKIALFYFPIFPRFKKKNTEESGKCSEQSQTERLVFGWRVVWAMKTKYENRFSQFFPRGNENILWLFFPIFFFCFSFETIQFLHHFWWLIFREE